MSGAIRIWEAGADFRTKATGGVAAAALTLLLPFTVLSLVQQSYLSALGTSAIVAMLALNAWLVAHGRPYERLTLYGLVPFGMLFMIHVFRLNGIIGGVWCFPAILGCYCMLSQRRALIANAIILGVALPMIWQTVEPALAARFSATLLAVSIFAGILVREIDAMRERLRYQIEHDPLTGLLNRTSLRERLESAIDARCTRAIPSALLAIDLDHFKSINDRFGHDTGDLALREVGKLLRERVRCEDAVFRLGGEEFLILLHGTTVCDAKERAEKLRETIERSSILQHCPVTASFGLTNLRMADDRDSWTRRADERLYAAKRAGRNRVVWQDKVAGGAGEALHPTTSTTAASPVGEIVPT